MPARHVSMQRANSEGRVGGGEDLVLGQNFIGAPVVIGNFVCVFSSNRFTEPTPTRHAAGHLECRDLHHQHTNPFVYTTSMASVDERRCRMRPTRRADHAARRS
jgi:hypothetical protein